VPTMGEPDHKTGEPGGHAEILYQDVRVPFENVVGGEAGIGQGFALAQKRLGPGRIHHAMRWLGQSQRAFDMLCERALTRYAHGSLLAEKQMVQDWIAESYAEMQAARLLTLQAAWKMDQLHAAGKHYSDARVEIGVIKFWGAKVLYNVIDRAIQIHGSLGYTTGAEAIPGQRSAPRAPAHPSQGGSGEVRRLPRPVGHQRLINMAVESPLCAILWRHVRQIADASGGQLPTPRTTGDREVNLGASAVS
jgi:alkylation response protein AidB-like acyl-CoA dehydrogenase